jgi:hypothetical protein
MLTRWAGTTDSGALTLADRVVDASGRYRSCNIAEAAGCHHGMFRHCATPSNVVARVPWKTPHAVPMRGQRVRCCGRINVRAWSGVAGLADGEKGAQRTVAAR